MVVFGNTVPLVQYSKIKYDFNSSALLGNMSRNQRINKYLTLSGCTNKALEENGMEKFLAKLVVRGFTQKGTKDFDDIYSPVARMNTIRTLVVVGKQSDFYFKLDVQNSIFKLDITLEDFLIGVYIYPPNGLECEPGHVLKLNKCLYRLKYH